MGFHNKGKKRREKKASKKQKMEANFIVVVCSTVRIKMRVDQQKRVC